MRRPCCGGTCLVAHTGWDNLTPVTLCMLLIPFSFQAISPIVPVVMIAIVVFTLVDLLLIMFTEPGILPTITYEEYDEQDSTAPVRIVSRIVLDGREYELREFRAKFSRYTGNCIESFDHFCGWTGAVIGKRNYRYFVLFLGLCLLLSIGLAGSCTALLVIKAERNHLTVFKTIEESIPETVLGSYGYLMLFSLFGLLYVSLPFSAAS
ncbi:Palmitoyltransferase [Hondaea fermentalgiana]|uniref:Palmitoyltransferase n=1 Tax=Hondaea fermentalgiana TaxID=2315210 RepID=A0A2R5GSK6_9STRA|nr:Palmitoyltransferase [Hondaea fermentalgiana]|eukprot:GBG33575.1 Palmitoyltransferase [Hondaea fermentalgiana]